MALRIGRSLEGRLHLGQELRTRAAGDVNTVPEAEPALVCSIQSREFRDDAFTLNVGLAGGGPGFDRSATGRAVAVIPLLVEGQCGHGCGRRPEPRVGVDQLDLLDHVHGVSNGPSPREQSGPIVKRPIAGKSIQKPGCAFKQRSERGREHG